MQCIVWRRQRELCNRSKEALRQISHREGISLLSTTLHNSCASAMNAGMAVNVDH
jgi:hypothetical protein